ASPRAVPRSCHLCHRRKIRCDKQEPCAGCVRAGKPCIYPPADQVIRRPRRTKMDEVASRLSSLEETLNVARRTERSESSSTQAAVATAMASHPKRRRILVQSGTSSHYYNEVLLSSVISEDIGSPWSTPAKASPDTDSSTHPNFSVLGIISQPNLAKHPSGYYPPKHLALRLWHIYVDIVEFGTSLKVLHVPSAEITVCGAINEPESASGEDLALCFAVFYMALIAIGDEEAELILRHKKVEGLSRFKLALRVHNHGKSIWIVNGIAIRAAQALGLHRDGERLGLSPFQSELRRRLWWQILNLESRAAEDYGLHNVGSSTLLLSNMRIPLNVEDSDLYPEMTELPPPRRGCTMMTFSIITIHLARALHQLGSAAAAATFSSPPSEELRARVVEETRAKVEGLLEHCNTVVPRQRLVVLLSRFIVRKLDHVTRHQWLALQNPDAREQPFASAEGFAEALEVLQAGMAIASDEMLKPYMWAMKAFPQYHVTLYLLWSLCVNPEGPDVDRAWVSLDSAIASGFGHGMVEGLGSKGWVFSALITRAKALREKA
ncbi:hypothetical protein BX600DRAFT_370275, partial [Xylariales sp. PMI_506]